MSNQRRRAGGLRAGLDFRVLIGALALAAAVVLLPGDPPTALAHVRPGPVLVIDREGAGIRGALFLVDPETGDRTILSDFGDPAQGPVGLDPQAVALETSGTILVIDSAAGADFRGLLFRVNPTSGRRTVLSDFGDATKGPLGRDPTDVALEASRTILVIDRAAGTDIRGALFRVHRTTGQRTMISDFGDSSRGPLGDEPRGVAVEASGAVVVLDALAGTGDYGALFRVDPATGQRTQLSDFGNEEQGPRAFPLGVAVEQSGAILVTGAKQLFRVNPTSGNRTVLSDFGDPAQGPLGVSPWGVTPEFSGEILVVDRGFNDGGELFRVDPVFGDRAIVSDFGSPLQGPLGSQPQGVDVPTVPPAVSGCIAVHGEPLAGRTIRFTQPEESLRTTTTDARGCYRFETAVSGKTGKIIINLPVFP